MSRYTLDIATEKSPDALNPLIATYLASVGFKPKMDKGEHVFVKKFDAINSPFYIRINFTGYSVKIEAYMKNFLLPFIFSGENDLALNNTPKCEELKKYANAVENIIKL